MLVGLMAGGWRSGSRCDIAPVIAARTADQTSVACPSEMPKSRAPTPGKRFKLVRRELLAPPLTSDRSLQLGGLARSNAAPTRDGGPATAKSTVLLSEVRLRKLVAHSDRGIDANHLISKRELIHKSDSSEG